MLTVTMFLDEACQLELRIRRGNDDGSEGKRERMTSLMVRSNDEQRITSLSLVQRL